MAKFEVQLYEVLNYLKANMRVQPLMLGGVASISGGAGGPPGGFVGYLPQTRVAYDSGEISSSGTPISGASLLDNLNHIRYRIDNIEAGTSGIFSVLDNGILVSSGVTGINFSSGLDVTLDGTVVTVVASGISGSSALESILLIDSGNTTTEFEFNASGLQDAINLAIDTNTIIIPAGNITGNFTIVNKSINLIGAGKYLTKITGNISVTTNNSVSKTVTIKGLEVYSSTNSAGILNAIYANATNGSGNIDVYISDCKLFVWNQTYDGNSAVIHLNTSSTEGYASCYLDNVLLSNSFSGNPTYYCGVLLNYYNYAEIKNCFFDLSGLAIALQTSEPTYNLFNCEFNFDDSAVIKNADTHNSSDLSSWYIDNNLGVTVGDTHASDVYDGTPQIHLPLPIASGVIPISDGTKWTTTPYVVGSGTGVSDHTLLTNLNSTSYYHLTQAEFNDINSRVYLDKHITNVADNYIAQSQDELIIMGGANVVHSITLPLASGTGKEFVIFCNNLGSVSVIPSGIDVINGESLINVNAGEGIILYDTANGNWDIAAHYPAGTHNHSHSDLTNLNTTNYYHLTQTEYQDLTDGGITNLHSHTPASGNSTLIIKESDNIPTISGVSTIVFPNGTITDSGGGVVTIASLGSGDVVGPAVVTSGHLAVFDGTTGKLIKDGGAIPSGTSLPPTINIYNITNFY